MTGPNFLGNLARRDGLGWLVAALARVRPPLLSSQISRSISLPQVRLSVTLFRPLISHNVLDRWGVLAWLGLAGLCGNKTSTAGIAGIAGIAERRGITEYSALGSSDCACKPTCSLVPVSISIHSPSRSISSSNRARG